MFRTKIRTICALVALATFAMPEAGAEFKYPNLTPAVKSALAERTRLMAVTLAGNDLVAVGPRGHILISMNGGERWKQVDAPVSSDLVAVHFPTAKKGWAVGHDGVVLHSEDGGRTWVKQMDASTLALMPLPTNQSTPVSSDGESLPFLDVLFLNDKVGFVVGAFNLTIHTNDGGNTWHRVDHQTANEAGSHLYSLTMVNGHPFIVGEQGLLRRWSETEGKFVAVQSPYEGSFFGVCSYGEVVLAFGMRGNLVRSADGGNTWKTVELDIGEGITAGAALDSERFVLVTQGGKLLVSRDKGLTFFQLSPHKVMPFYGVTRMSDASVALVGAHGVTIEEIK